MKPPKFLADIYRDLRDRHLLLPALALVVGLIAVPMVLASGDPAPAPAPAPAASAEPAATIPAVLADTDVSVRDYRQRLEGLRSKNPFHQLFQTSAKDGNATGGDPAQGGAGAPASDAPATSPLAVPPDTSTPPTDSSGGNDDTSGDSTPDDVDVVNQLFVRRVDVMVGVQGDLERRKSVKPMTLLPSQGSPVAAFLGTDEGGKRAAFVVSSDVTSVGGDGACVPSPSCLFITLEKGESATFDYAPDGQTYELQLLAIRNVKLKTD